MRNEYYEEHKEVIDTLIKSRYDIRNEVIDYNDRLEKYNKQFRKEIYDEVLEFFNTLKPNTDKWELVGEILKAFKNNLLARDLLFDFPSFFQVWLRDNLKKWFKVICMTSNDPYKPCRYYISPRNHSSELEYLDIPNSLYSGGITCDAELTTHSLLNLNTIKALKVAQLKNKELLDVWQVLLNGEFVKKFDNEDDAIDFAHELSREKTQADYIEVYDAVGTLCTDYLGEL